MHNQTIDDFTNLLKDTLMSDRVSTHSTPLPILVKDVKKQISEDSTNNSAEKARQLANLDKAYQIVVAELVGSN
ncbi:MULTISPECIES: hypothetical protein [unclassified Sporosarcina]|uniref:hypothetical protein n=1 Tax=unclassified Sporosarcina TaxID=2647733 RepID=UPI000C16D857|nr:MULTISPECIES: hypothetical protein [unclassified Sporosarcina]PIC99093.1 hypothetical protein CSV68_09690 [Sporosarcina sp. P29]PID05559.1 hypothetical protein CSV66_09120 [Sporosarcina sp. P30]PID08753.1 hypothetical protein CSV65_09120 [Sporosarcina sp. P31]PID11925.1 hypothetical protein CSV64_09230 [Sporosarcina sp. P32b]